MAREIRPMLYTMEVQLTLIEEIRVAQGRDPQLDRIRTEVLAGKAHGFVIRKDGKLRF